MQAKWANYAIGCLLVAAPIVLIDYLAPQWVPWLVAETGPVQLLQAMLLVLAAAGLTIGVARERFTQQDLPAAVLFAFLCFVLAWREIEIDNHLWDVHAFSWKFLTKPGLPLSVKLTLAVPGILLPVGIFIYIVRAGYSSVFRTIRTHSEVSRLITSGVIVLALSQLWDKGRTIARHLGWTMFLHLREEPNPLPEEILELLGELLIFWAAVIFIRNARPEQTKPPVPVSER